MGSGAVCAGSNPAGGTRQVTSKNQALSWADADMRERESVSLTPALSRCLSLFATHLRHTLGTAVGGRRRCPLCGTGQIGCRSLQAFLGSEPDKARTDLIEPMPSLEGRLS
jgi:hypothetical protein